MCIGKTRRHSNSNLGERFSRLSGVEQDSGDRLPDEGGTNPTSARSASAEILMRSHVKQAKDGEELP